MSRFLFSVVVEGAIALVAIIVGAAWVMQAAIPIFVGLTLVFIYQGLYQIPAQPPTKGALTFLGERTEEIIDEGWRFLPLRPFVFDVIEVNVSKINLDIDPKAIRTPDLAELSAPVSVTYTPTNLVAFLNAKGESGANNIITDVITEALREWAISDDWGPKDWIQALKKRGEAIPVLINAVLGHDLDRPVDPVTVSAVRSGNGDVENEELGFKLNRLNIGEMKVLGELAGAAEKEAKEKRERTAEELELRHVLSRVKALMKPPQARGGGLGLTAEQALEIVQTERTKVVKTVSESKLNVSPETRALVLRLFGKTDGDHEGGDA